MKCGSMLSAVIVCGVWLGPLGCAGSKGASRSSGLAGLSGYWVTKDPPRNPTRCRAWMQFHADSTLETNLSRSRCYSAYLMTYTVRPPFLNFSTGPRRFFCRYAVRGGRMKLACSKRRVPPDFQHAIVLHRRPTVRRGGTLADLAGTWRLRFWRRLVSWTISRTGQVSMGPGRTAQIFLKGGHTPHRFEMQMGASFRDRCIYRVGASHLTLCCGGRRLAGRYPRSIAACRFPIVLVRKRP